MVIVGAAVWLPAANQRSVSERLSAQGSAVQLMLTAMLDQETGLRGYSMTAQPVFLEPYVMGQREYDTAVAGAESISRGDDRVVNRLRGADVIARRWQDAARGGVQDVRAHARLRDFRPVLARKAIMDRYRQAIGATVELLATRRDEALKRAEIVPVVLVVLLSLAFFVLGWLLVVRPRLRAAEAERRARLRAAQQTEFAETLQVVGSEEEAHSLLRRHLERALPDASATVLNRNSSENRLECSSEDGACGPLADALIDAEPRSCLAIRHGRAHREGGGEQPLLGCRLCSVEVSTQNTERISPPSTASVSPVT